MDNGYIPHKIVSTRADTPALKYNTTFQNSFRNVKLAKLRNPEGNQRTFYITAYRHL